MFVRLAFATQIFSEPDILIVDEALSVGDIRFQQKCYRAMDQLMKDKTVILVTHDTAAVTRFCKRVIWLNHGEKMFDGDTVEGLQKYQEYLINLSISENEDVKSFDDDKESIGISSGEADINSIPNVIANSGYKGNGNAMIIKAAILDEDNKVVDIIEPNQKIKCAFVIEYKKPVERPILGLEVFDRLGNIIFSINSETLNVRLPQGKGIVRYDLSIIVPELNHGEYTISPAIASGYQEPHVQMCWIDDALSFRIPPREYDIPGFFYVNKGKIEAYQIEENE